MLARIEELDLGRRTSQRVDDAQLAEDLAAAGLAVDAYLTDNRTWIRARPAAGRDGGGG